MGNPFPRFTGDTSAPLGSFSSDSSCVETHGWLSYLVFQLRWCVKQTVSIRHLGAYRRWRVIGGSVEQVQWNWPIGWAGQVTVKDACWQTHENRQAPRGSSCWWWWDLSLLFLETCLKFTCVIRTPSLCLRLHVVNVFDDKMSGEVAGSDCEQRRCYTKCCEPWHFVTWYFSRL